MKKIIFMGTPDFSVGTLKALLDSEYEVQAVFTQPDKPKGRGKALQMTPVKAVALEAGVPVYQPRRIREPENLEILRKYQPDAIVVVAFGQIIPREILELPPYGCINVHASLLPKYRGFSASQVPGSRPHSMGGDRRRKGKRSHYHADGYRAGYGGYAAEGSGSYRRAGDRREPV